MIDVSAGKIDPRILPNENPKFAVVVDDQDTADIVPLHRAKEYNIILLESGTMDECIAVMDKEIEGLKKQAEVVKNAKLFKSP